MNLEFIFKVIDKDEWQKAKKSGTYGGSEKDLKDGYIHFSEEDQVCLLYTSPSPRDGLLSRMPSSA